MPTVFIAPRGLRIHQELRSSEIAPSVVVSLGSAQPRNTVSRRWRLEAKLPAGLRIWNWHDVSHPPARLRR